MSSSDSINRDSLIKLMNLVRPALATQDYIPAYKHICFKGGYATTYNDIAAIKVKLPYSAELDLGLCLPGEMLIKALGSFNAEKVMLQPGKDASLLVASGRSKLKLPTLPAKDFPLNIPEASKVPVVVISDDMLTGLQRCLLSVGNDPTHPAQQGITLDIEDGKALLFSTDNTTISRYKTKTKIELPGDAPVILPTFFCEQLVNLAKAFPACDIEIELHAGALVAYFFDEHEVEQAVMFQKTLVDLEPLDFPAIVAKHVKLAGLAEQLVEIPAAFDAALSRALLVLATEVDKVTKVEVGPERIRLLSTSSNGEASDDISFEGPGRELDPFHIDPALLSRGCKACSHIGFFNRVVVLANKDATFTHLIAHCA